MKNTIFRIIFLLLLLLVNHKKFGIPNFDLLSSSILIIGLVLTFKNQQKSIDFLSDYLFWTIAAIIILNPNFVVLLTIANPLFIVLMVKVILLIISFLKFQKIIVPTSLSNRIWIVSVLLWLLELSLNSTYTMMRLCIFFGGISAIDSLITLLRMKQWSYKVLYFGKSEA
jgi:hypothetical protein